MGSPAGPQQLIEQLGTMMTMTLGYLVLLKLQILEEVGQRQIWSGGRLLDGSEIATLLKLNVLADEDYA